jgi:hypothetical protein
MLAVAASQQRRVMAAAANDGEDVIITSAPQALSRRLYNRATGYRMKNIVLFLSLFLIAPSAAVAAPPQHGIHTGGRDVTVERMQKDLAKKRNEERQAQLKKDTDQLLQLSTELKKQVDRSNEYVLSLDVIKTAEKIEKLAKSVREKMKADAYNPAIQ